MGCAGGWSERGRRTWQNFPVFRPGWFGKAEKN